MPNLLAQETSPYLLQHADNPVQWQPWGPAALDLARREDKPILLSIGYSACHWCHVMAHESFADSDVAAEMNRHFVNIKVDREERPDLDQIYQTAHQLIAGRAGGWPLTVFLTPEQVPFFAGTYFPKQARYQMPGFIDLLPRVAAFYREHKAEIAAQNGTMLAALEPAPPSAGAATLSADLIEAGAQQILQGFDRVYGGFSAAPKFPRPSELEFGLHQASLREAVLFTLEKMADGGLFDQLGGGFYRYSVDERWAIPHFEKMLYDNGPLLALYAEAYAATGKPRFKTICEETVAWLAREMAAPEGGFYSALDADSEHEEGKFYVWTQTEVAALVSAEEYAVLAPYHGLDSAPNFEGRYWHFVVNLSSNIGDTEKRLLTSAREKLFAARARRVPPGRDDKVLTSWNALAIRGLARAGRVFGRSDWVALAQAAADFIRLRLWQNQRLLATYKAGQAKLNAYLDDYAFLLDALLELMQAAFRPRDLAWARELAEVVLDQFEDGARGGFFFTSHDHEKLIHRPKQAYDNATPSGNGVAAFALQRLGHLLGEKRYIDASERALTFFKGQMGRYPAAFPSLLATLEEQLEPPTLVVLRGPAQALPRWTEALAGRSNPHAVVLALPNGLGDLPETLNKPESEAVNAWVCRGVNCLPPLQSPEALADMVNSGQVG